MSKTPAKPAAPAAKKATAKAAPAKPAAKAAATPAPTKAPVKAAAPAAKPAPRGGYTTSRYHASFVGAVPASDPRLVILVTVDEPSTIWGGTVAAPAFQQIARFALQYLEIPPDAAS